MNKSFSSPYSLHSTISETTIKKNQLPLPKLSWSSFIKNSDKQNNDSKYNSFKKN